MDNQTKINFNVNDADDLHCPECNNLYFTNLTRIKKVSALISPTGKEAILPVQVLSCAKCDAVINDLKDFK